MHKNSKMSDKPDVGMKLTTVLLKLTQYDSTPLSYIITKKVLHSEN